MKNQVQQKFDSAKAAKQKKAIHELYKGHEIISTGNTGLKILCYDGDQLPFYINIAFNHDLTKYSYWETFTEYSEDWMMEEMFSTFEELLNKLK